MIAVRRLVSFVPAATLTATLAATVLTASDGLADVHTTVESIAAKGTINPIVPVEGGLGLTVAAALVAIGMERRSRR
jgi:branched-subunit amino acid transport protein